MVSGMSIVVRVAANRRADLCWSRPRGMSNEFLMYIPLKHEPEAR
jgi:hypothetical protein